MIPRPDFLPLAHQQAAAHGRGERVVRCALCDWACDRKPEKQIAYCAKVRILVNTTTDVVCPYFFPAR